MREITVICVHSKKSGILLSQMAKWPKQTKILIGVFEKLSSLWDFKTQNSPFSQFLLQFYIAHE